MKLLQAPRMSRAMLVMALLALVVAACAPAATPTPTPMPPTATPQPTEVPTEDADVEAIVALLADDEDATATAEATAATTAEPTETATEEAGDEATAEPADADATAEASTASGDGERGVVGVTSTRLREAPSLTGSVIMEISRGTEVLALGETANQGYLYIRLEDGTEGWVAKQAINMQNHFATLPVIEP